VHRPDRGVREAGSGVVEAFYAGYDRVTTPDWDFLVKLDGDLSFQPDYFEKCLAEFHTDQTLGIGGGAVCHRHNGELLPEPHPRFHVRGATKIYRRACWQQISGLIQAPGWDTVDEVKANMLGWSTRTFLQQQLLHHRPTGAASGTWQNAVKNGKASYISGYHPLFMFLKSLKCSFRTPIVSVGLLWGFLLSHFQRVPQVEDNALIAYLRSQQLRRLFFMSSIWR
jgi:poly-beta-1,6-N-acetyl-D-glucosamine synthase